MRDATPVKPQANKKGFYYFLFIVAMYGLIGRTVGYFMPIYFKELGLTGLQIGLYFSMGAIATILLALPLGISTDRKNIKSLFMISFFLLGLSYVGFLISRSFIVFCVFALVGSFGANFYSVAQGTLFFKMTGADNRDAAGIYQLLSFVATGLGLLLGGIVIADFSFRYVFILMVAGNGLLVLLSYFLPHSGSAVIKLEEYQRSVFTPQVLFLALIFFLNSLHWGAETVSYGPFLSQVLGLTAKQLGVYTGVGYVFVGLGAYGGTILLRKGWLIKDIRSLLVLGIFLSGLFHILMTVPNVYWSFSFRLMHEIGDGFTLLAFYHGIAKIFNLDRIGGCTAFISLGNSIAAFVSALAFGYVGDAFGPQWSLIISGVISVCAALLLRASRQVLLAKPDVAVLPQVRP